MLIILGYCCTIAKYLTLKPQNLLFTHDCNLEIEVFGRAIRAWDGSVSQLVQTFGPVWFQEQLSIKIRHKLCYDLNAAYMEDQSL